MSFRKSLLIGVAILALAVSLSAQSSTASTETITGTVVSSGPALVVIDTDAGRKTFVVDTDSTVPSNLVAGSRVTVDFNRLSDDRMHAATVALLGTEPITSTSTATTAPPSMGPAQTVTGTVISSGNGQLVLDTPSGQRTFIVDDDSHLASDVTVGSRATVEYHTLSSGRLHAGDVTMVMAAQPYATTPMAAAPAPARIRTASALPRTASDLPLVGLVGLIALAGAVGVRVARHTA